MKKSHCSLIDNPMAITTTDRVVCVPSSDEGSGVQWPAQAQHEEANEPALLLNCWSPPMCVKRMKRRDPGVEGRGIGEMAYDGLRGEVPSWTVGARDGICFR